MALYMLDTTIASAALRGTPGIDERLQRLVHFQMVDGLALENWIRNN